MQESSDRGKRLSRRISTIAVIAVLLFIAIKTQGFRHFTSTEWFTTLMFCLILYVIPQVIYVSFNRIKNLFGPG